VRSRLTDHNITSPRPPLFAEVFHTSFFPDAGKATLLDGSLFFEVERLLDRIGASLDTASFEGFRVP